MTQEKQTRFSEIAQRHGDPWIWGIYFTLLIVSIVFNYSASSREVAAHGVYATIIKQVFFLAACFRWRTSTITRADFYMP